MSLVNVPASRPIRVTTGETPGGGETGARPPGGRRNRRQARLHASVRRALFYALLAIVLAVFVFPFFWMVLNSFKTSEKIQEYPPIFRFSPTLANFRSVLGETPFLSYARNSLIVSSGAVTAGMALALPAAYGIARYGHRVLAVGILVCRMIPIVSFLLPWFIVFRALGLLDSFLALVLAHLVITVPLITWIMLGFFEDVPIELEEAARIDGCSTAGVFFRIALPLVRPGLASAGILAFIYTWNHFLLPLILAGPRTTTLPVIVYSFMTFDELNLGGVYAAATLITLPVIVMVLMIQRHLVRGLTIGGLKG